VYNGLVDLMIPAFNVRPDPFRAAADYPAAVLYLLFACPTGDTWLRMSCSSG
jgi:hypothetical protein